MKTTNKTSFRLLSEKPVYRLALCGVLIALASALSNLKVWQMPLGGSVTALSMLPVVMLAVILGTGRGTAAAFVYSLIQLFFGITISGLLGWGLTWYALVGTVFLDYIVPYTLLGFAGVFRKWGAPGICAGTAMVLAARFVCHFVSGIILFGSVCPWKNIPLYSLCYNGAYMLPELIFTVAGAALLFRLPQIKKLASH